MPKMPWFSTLPTWGFSQMIRWLEGEDIEPCHDGYECFSKLALDSAMLECCQLQLRANSFASKLVVLCDFSVYVHPVGSSLKGKRRDGTLSW